MTNERAECADHLGLVDAAADHPRSREAELLKLLCYHCPIALDCLAKAMESPHHEWGIWGATSPHQRTLHGAKPTRNNKAA